ncbi:MAG: N-acetylneuraminate synthase [Chromatiaceae bacterium]|nr:N-acetylneuraminate synthase [Chromatiaceae bacterium]
MRESSRHINPGPTEVIALNSRIVDVRLGTRDIGPTRPCFVIAEAGVNHNGDPDRAHALVDAAASAGADAVKFQTFKTECLVTRHAPKAGYQLETTGSLDPAQAAMLKALELSPGVHRSLMAHCAARGILFLSTPYDWASARLLHGLGIAGLKIASTDTTNLPFLRQLDTLGLPIVLSTGMCDLGEVREAVAAMSATRQANRLVILQCTSQYPSPEDQLDLRAIQTMSDEFACPVGFSDHTTGIEIAAWAVAAGAVTIEKHLTLDRSLPGPDHRASLEPAELARMVADIRRVEVTLGDGLKRIQDVERPNKSAMQKSLVMARSLPKGVALSHNDVLCKRPATGLHPKYLDSVIGKQLRRDVPMDAPLTAEDLVDWTPM